MNYLIRQTDKLLFFFLEQDMVGYDNVLCILNYWGSGICVLLCRIWISRRGTDTLYAQSSSCNSGGYYS